MTDVRFVGTGDGSFERLATWQPVDRHGRVRIGLARNQQVAWIGVTASVTLVTVSLGALLARPALVLAAGALAALSAAYAWFVGIELGPTTLTIFGPSLRQRTLWARTVRWTSVLAIQTTHDGEIWLSFPGEPPVLVRAPRGQWLGRDRDFDRKVAVLTTWWDLHCAASLHERPRTSLTDVRAALMGEPLPTSWPRSTVAPTSSSRSWHPPAAMAALASSAATPVPVATDDGEATGRSTPFPLATLIGFFALAVGVGYLFVGRDIVVLAIALLVLLRFGRDPGRPMALGAFALLVLSAVATVVQDQPATVNLAYATRRTVAVEAGAVIGVFLMVATVIFAVTERATDPAPARALVRSLDRLHLRTLQRILPSWVRAAVPYALIAGAAALVRAVGSPAAVPDAYDALVANLRLGTGYSLVLPNGGVPTGDVPPLAPMLLAYSPLGPRFALLLVSTAIVVLTGWSAHRRWGRAAGIMAALVAAVLPSLWSAALPVQLAALAVLAAVEAAEPTRLTTARAAGAGVCLGLAALARPDAALALLVVALWMGRQHRRPTAVLALVGAWTATVLPWWNFVRSELGAPWLTQSLAAFFNDPELPTPAFSALRLVLAAAVAAAVGMAMAGLWARRFALLPLFALPGITLLLAATDPGHRDLFTWSAPLVAVLLGWWAAQLVRRHLGRVLEVRYDDELDWDAVFDEERRRGGADDRVVDDAAIGMLQPDDDRLFL